MSRILRKVSVLVRTAFSVYDSSDVAVTGLVNGDFTKRLAKDGANDATVVTVTEIANGRYEASFTPASTGFWYLTVTQATHNPRGWDESFDVTTDGDFTVAGILAGTITELSGVPAASPTLTQALALLYMALRNKVDVDATTKEVHNDAGTVIATKTLSDNGTTYSETKMA